MSVLRRKPVVVSILFVTLLLTAQKCSSSDYAYPVMAQAPGVFETCTNSHLNCPELVTSYHCEFCGRTARADGTYPAEIHIVTQRRGYCQLLGGRASRKYYCGYSPVLDDDEPCYSCNLTDGSGKTLQGERSTR